MTPAERKNIAARLNTDAAYLASFVQVNNPAYFSTLVARYGVQGSSQDQINWFAEQINNHNNAVLADLWNAPYKNMAKDWTGGMKDLPAGLENAKFDPSTIDWGKIGETVISWFAPSPSGTPGAGAPAGSNDFMNFFMMQTAQQQAQAQADAQKSSSLMKTIAMGAGLFILVVVIIIMLIYFFGPKTKS